MYILLCEVIISSVIKNRIPHISYLFEMRFKSRKNLICLTNLIKISLSLYLHKDYFKYFLTSKLIIELKMSFTFYFTKY